MTGEPSPTVSVRNPPFPTTFISVETRRHGISFIRLAREESTQQNQDMYPFISFNLLSGWSPGATL